MLSLVFVSDFTVVTLIGFSLFFGLELCLNLDIDVSQVYLVEDFICFLLSLLVFYSLLLLDLKT